ncbi:adenylosuccinate lyase family protein [Plantactinospora sp. KLBMP9567]|uniref:class-II fumarase/aspartase family protein n=1 Tax=Plantactinospora sp. KLBMP9567 TaxID=3085900 RepID=UPI002981401F|nr:adenylosuccinate lyase family protein [Plantactinospora sp. KLBMP9567]MDW5330200.1 adenylosuccinate lyase family protein [Plantactinospora sp. KLBMP9567]
MTAPFRSPFSLLTQLVGDQEQLGIFAPDGCLESWLAAERALALGQAASGVIEVADAEAIVAAACAGNIDHDRLWAKARTVGYPIVGLVREIERNLSDSLVGRVHFGATTQDIMDTGLALQLSRSLSALDRRLGDLGDAIAEQTRRYAHTVMAARTHAQQAVPTTFGATLATLLAQFARHRRRLAQAHPRIAVVSLFGAGGTSAALGERAGQIRADMAERLNLYDTEMPWHADRDGVAEFGWLCATITAACAKLARNVVDLSRTEIGEVSEPYVSHRGASSTMPQKVNPISSEAIIGLSGAAGALSSSLLRLQEAGHERAAGEWQIEWHVIPQLAVLAGSALGEALTLVRGLRVDPDRMRTNLLLGGGTIMAEAQMMRLAETMGHDRAHALVYEAAARTRQRGIALTHSLREVAEEQNVLHLVPDPLITADDYLGQAVQNCARTVNAWQQTPALKVHDIAISELARERH